MKRLLVAIATLALVLVGTMAAAAWLSSGDGTATASATSLGTANTPDATRGDGVVDLSWDASTLLSGDPVGGYTVIRHHGSDTPVEVCTTTTTGCTDPAPLATAVSYGVVATIGADWRGPESALTAFTYDDVAPSTLPSVSPAPNTAGWNQDTVTVTLQASESGSPSSGVDHITYAVDGGTSVDASGASASFPVAGAGSHTVTFFAVDRAGNAETSKSTTIRIDPNAPTTSATPNPLPNGSGWNHTDVSLSFTATDSGTSGIKSIAVDGTTTSGSTASKTVTAEGTTVVSYFATDVADNVEGAKTLTLKIDKTAPTASIDPAGGPSWTGDNTVTITASDALSGVASTQYSVDSAALQAYTGPVTLTDGTHSFRYVVTDVAGNANDQTATVKVDSVKPTSTIARTTSTTWTITAADAAPSSGVSIESWVDGGAHTTLAGTSATITLTEGNHTIHWLARDAAGNQEAQHDLGVTVSTADTTAPTVSLTYPTVVNPIINNGQWTNSGCAPVGKPAGLCGTASDNVGVVGSAQYELRRTSVSPNTCWNGSAFTQAACGTYQTAGGTAASWQIAMAFSSLPSGTFELRVKVSDAAGNTNRSGTTPGGPGDLTFTK